ncbi:MAG: hypothetical protein UX80_C0009G0027 [Candidatus Amesbacteria bacterium GW2011_GWA2_47_11b]|uniref:Mannosyl-glycoprotein endo-beta-N-acetylglucosamidase-like domain-containing protein n=2 Tax=Candidatus Amesiibacteriota TaxID=1752730 RepID=A0A0G1SIY1_9BACT|nr:MAG: hypothetical protein UX00_C0011G0031 [Microgenomates group bacterium GW2011_GWB1_45_17]KKU28881.1 MAG: hypothetical protein UX42_C0006G0033 [Microgenomates group bacterium GW2011_GWC1_46_20]KKU57812.1 MAG: hypothetical protein UX80_C0009G0027 [Candidatus Amesbacteria bacterium GW2011_GWA2_47_11b]KKU69412.1 MAG: hypothetical protein UX92_C0013G0017 [Candidatus Amesbacteria bacterium GW2011_GWA1_47_20]
MNRILWLVSFAVGAPCTLVAAILLFFTFSPSPSAPLPAPRVLSATAPAFPSINSTVIAADARTIVLHRYLTRYKSPLIPLAGYIVATSDEYLLDYRLLVAIAQQESNLCKKIIPNSHNCWGYGIYGDKVTKFSSYEEGIKIVAKGLKKNYIDKGLTSPEEIMTKYTPPALEKGGSWAKGINQFLDDIELL